MEKLIELLNKYGKEHFEKCTNSENELRIRKEICTEAYDEEVIISKRFGFIKRLVDNDKIDRDRVSETENKQIVKIQRTIENIKMLRYTTLLMLLAISDTPIEDILSYLK